MTELDAAELVLFPYALSALTTNVYAVPFVNPVTTMLEMLTPVATTEPGLDVTRYVTPAAPAVPAAPCVHVTVA